MCWPYLLVPRGLVQTRIRRKGRAALACGLGERGLQGPFIVCLAQGMRAPPLGLSLSLPGQEKPGGGVVKESGRHWVAVPGPPSQSGKLGCPWLTAAVAVLVCESQQPTLPSWDFRAVECLEGRLCGSSEKGCVCAVTPQFLEPCREH